MELQGKSRPLATLAFDAMVVAAAAAFWFWPRQPASQKLDYVPLTNFADSAMSPDGRMVAFIRGGEYIPGSWRSLCETASR